VSIARGILCGIRKCAIAKVLLIISFVCRRLRYSTIGKAAIPWGTYRKVIRSYVQQTAKQKAIFISHKNEGNATEMHSLFFY